MEAENGKTFERELVADDLIIFDYSGNSNQVFKFHLNIGPDKLSFNKAAKL